MLSCLGVGVGPANLSVACQLVTVGAKTLFLDRKPAFSWHKGMQIEGTKLQVSIFKDLVTLADPTSPFSFISYLHQNARLYHFLNAQFDSVSRREFSDYLAWVSERLPNTRFGETVEDVGFDGIFHVTTDLGVYHARNISVAIGKMPAIPAFAQNRLGPAMFHSSEFVQHGRAIGGKRVAVVGGGQSGAEIFLDCISRTGAEAPAHVNWISSRSNFWPIDDSPFTNDLFMPCQVAHFAAQCGDRRSAFLHENVLASDGISMSTLQEIYQKMYVRRFIEGDDYFASMAPSRRVTTAMPSASGLTVRVLHKSEGSEEVLPVDMVILATGYRDGETPFLDSLSGRIQKTGNEIAVDDDFAALWDGPPDRSIFVQNAARGQKGLADPNLSLVAWRAERIVSRILGRVPQATALPSFIDWSAAFAEEPAERITA
jgi:lysine N6-hydroxylase